jgi:hypothetical protein
MSDETRQAACCVKYVPSRRERFWRKLGFRFHLGDERGPELPAPAGWMRTTCQFGFDWADRLRILITGRLDVTMTYDLDVPSPDKIRTRMDWQIKAPGEGF